jgi:hypothetical protein
MPTSNLINLPHVSRREFIKYAGIAGGSLMLGRGGGLAMSRDQISQVVLVHTEDRQSGVVRSIRALGVNPVKNKDVLSKPNFNTADVVPGSTHNDTLVALVEELWQMGAATITLGERSYPFMGTDVFAQEQIARAVELGLGAASAAQIALVAADDESRQRCDRIAPFLNAA